MYVLLNCFCKCVLHVTILIAMFLLIISLDADILYASLNKRSCFVNNLVFYYADRCMERTRTSLGLGYLL